MIKRFRHRGLKRFYERDDASQIDAEFRDKVQRILTILDAATAPGALDLPGFNLHPLKGDLKGFWSVTVRANWRIIFKFENGNAEDVDLIDYH